MRAAAQPADPSLQHDHAAQMVRECLATCVTPGLEEKASHKCTAQTVVHGVHGRLVHQPVFQALAAQGPDFRGP